MRTLLLNATDGTAAEIDIGDIPNYGFISPGIKGAHIMVQISGTVDGTVRLSFAADGATFSPLAGGDFSGPQAAALLLPAGEGTLQAQVINPGPACDVTLVIA